LAATWHAAAALGASSVWAAERTAEDQALTPESSLLRQFNLDGLSIDRNDIHAGGPPKDGIPALTKPKVVPAAQARFLQVGDRVVGVKIGDNARAYPIRVLNWHEVINDTLGTTPIAVIYCPLCDSVSVVDRRISKDKTVEFGISGLLLNSNVLLYDRTDQALWSQVSLSAVSGPHVGKSLVHLPWEIVTFGEWRKAYPQGTVVTLNTGHRRDYRRNPYADYFATDRLMFPVAKQDDRLPPKTRVVGVRLGDVTRAYPIEQVAGAMKHRVEDEIGGKRLVLEADAMAEMIRVVQIPEGAQAVHTFWFAWAAFHPQTEIFKGMPKLAPLATEPSLDQ
jgi:hypothetical protein